MICNRIEKNRFNHRTAQDCLLKERIFISFFVERLHYLNQLLINQIIKYQYIFVPLPKDIKISLKVDYLFNFD